jgi:hypothetical protein
MWHREIQSVSQLQIDGPQVGAVGGVRPPRDCSAIGKANGFSFLTRHDLNGRSVGALRLRGSLRVTGPERPRSLALIGRANMELRKKWVPFPFFFLRTHLMHLRMLTRPLAVLA